MYQWALKDYTKVKTISGWLPPPPPHATTSRLAVAAHGPVRPDHAWEQRQSLPRRRHEAGYPGFTSGFDPGTPGLPWPGRGQWDFSRGSGGGEQRWWQRTEILHLRSGRSSVLGGRLGCLRAGFSISRAQVLELSFRTLKIFFFFPSHGWTVWSFSLNFVRMLR